MRADVRVNFKTAWFRPSGRPRSTPVIAILSQQVCARRSHNEHSDTLRFAFGDGLNSPRAPRVSGARLRRPAAGHKTQTPSDTRERRGGRRTIGSFAPHRPAPSRPHAPAEEAAAVCGAPGGRRAANQSVLCTRAASSSNLFTHCRSGRRKTWPSQDATSLACIKFQRPAAAPQHVLGDVRTAQLLL